MLGVKQPTCIILEKGRGRKNIMSENNITDKNLTEIDKALIAAKARQATKQGMVGADGTTTASNRPTGEPKPAKPKLTDEEKQATVDARNAEREQRQAARTLERQAKKAAVLADRKPAHMRKVEKAAEKLSPLSDAATLLFAEATTNLPQSELAGLATHIMHFNRVQATERALDQKLVVGQRVTINESQDPRFVNKTGVIEKVQRIRCYVKVEGFNKPAYLFTSGVTVIADVPALEQVTETSQEATA